MARTALQLITDALLKVRALESGEVLTAEEANDGLRAFQDLQENWSIERLAVYQRSTEYFATVAGQASYTIGAGGNWNTTRPVRIAAQAVCRYQGIDYPVDASIDQATYDRIALKTQPGDIVERALYVNSYPLGSVTLWPVPQTSAPQIGLHIDRQLTSAAALTDVLAFPPGYELAFVYRLGIMLAPDYGVPVPAEVEKGAADFKADIRRANRVSRRARFDDVPGVMSGGESGSWQRGY